MELQKFEIQSFLDFIPNKGQIMFSGSRRLLFYADSLGELRRELVNSLGDNIARGILTRFGYQWGKKDASVQTLKFYIKNNYNLQQAAKAGFLSPSTLKYRLKKIQEVGNLDLNNPDARLLVELALKVIRGV